MLLLPRELGLPVVGVIANFKGTLPDVLDDPLVEFDKLLLSFLGEGAGWNGC